MQTYTKSTFGSLYNCIQAILPIKKYKFEDKSNILKIKICKWIFIFPENIIGIMLLSFYAKIIVKSLHRVFTKRIVKNALSPTGKNTFHSFNLVDSISINFCTLCFRYSHTICCRLVLTFFRFKYNRISYRGDFQKSQTFEKKDMLS